MKLHDLYEPQTGARPIPPLPPSITDVLSDPRQYLPSDDLVRAVNVALLLGLPLLVTGEPGTGKSSLSASVAHNRFGGRHLRYDVKSATTRTDLLYHFDELGRFRDIQTRRMRRRLIDYIRFEALGEGIIRAIDPNAPLFDMAGREIQAGHPIARELFGSAFTEQPKLRHLLLAPTAARSEARSKAVGEFNEPQRCVVLVDELDKAPRDTPNDLLAEFESMEFAIPEFGVRIRNPAPHVERLRPFVVVTSNSEKSLPEAFLRRCAYFHIAFPQRPEELRKIVETRISAFPSLGERKDLVDGAINGVLRLRAGSSLRKPPGVAELLAWLVLIARDPGAGEMTSISQLAVRHLPALIKLVEDVEPARRMLSERA